MQFGTASVPVRHNGRKQETLSAGERRSAERVRAYKAANLTFNGGYGAMQATIRDISEGGLRLSFGDATGLPKHFDVSVLGDAKRRPARLVWHLGTQAGIAFEG